MTDMCFFFSVVVTTPRMWVDLASLNKKRRVPSKQDTMVVVFLWASQSKNKMNTDLKKLRERTCERQMHRAQAAKPRAKLNPADLWRHFESSLSLERRTHVPALAVNPICAGLPVVCSDANSS